MSSYTENSFSEFLPRVYKAAADWNKKKKLVQNNACCSVDFIQVRSNCFLMEGAEPHSLLETYQHCNRFSQLSELDNTI